MRDPRSAKSSREDGAHCRLGILTAVFEPASTNT